MVSTHDVRVEGDVVVKRFRSAPRGEPDREWRALHALAEHAPGLAPTPLRYDREPPTVTMTRLPGTELCGPLSGEQLDALAVAVDRLFRVPAAAIGPAHSNAVPRRHVARIRRDLTSAADSDPLVVRAHDAARKWLHSRDIERYIEAEPAAVLGRGDYNLANFLWDGASVRMLDFEDSDPSDRGLELGLLLEHISARGTPDAEWERVVAAFELAPAERRRMVAARRTEATFWLAALRPGGIAERLNPPGTLHRQAERLLILLDAAS